MLLLLLLLLLQLLLPKLLQRCHRCSCPAAGAPAFPGAVAALLRLPHR
jgi:hypothetical protein